jgi:hypothetical protein
VSCGQTRLEWTLEPQLAIVATMGVGVLGRWPDFANRGTRCVQEP